jgi:hypothetical protein
MIGGVSAGLKQGATPYRGPLSAGIDPMSLMAANVMMGIGTKGSPGGQRGYTAPNFYGMQGGGGASNPWASSNIWGSSGGGGIPSSEAEGPRSPNLGGSETGASNAPNPWNPWTSPWETWPSNPAYNPWGPNAQLP